MEGNCSVQAKTIAAPGHHSIFSFPFEEGLFIFVLAIVEFVIVLTFRISAKFIWGCAVRI